MAIHVRTRTPLAPWEKGYECHWKECGKRILAKHTDCRVVRRKGDEEE